MSPLSPEASSTVARAPSSQITRPRVRGRRPAPEESPASAHDSAITSTILLGTLIPSLSPAYATALPRWPFHFRRPLRRVPRISTGAPLTARGRWTGRASRVGPRALAAPHPSPLSRAPPLTRLPLT